jgi:F-type H+-transporting ATPase subunit alpha
MVDQVALLASLAEGVFDAFPASVIAAVRARLAAHLDAQAHESVAEVAKTGELDDAIRGRLVEATRALVQEIAAA